MLWLNWVMATTAISLVVVLSLWVKAIWMPFVAFGLELVLFVLVRRNREAELPVCYLVPFITTRILFWTGVVMFVVNLLYSEWLIDKVFDPDTINQEIPFITILIMAPVTVVVTAWVLWRGSRLNFCQDCRMRHGMPAERGFLGVIFTQESISQTKMLLQLSIIITVASWTYYAVAYVNSDLNHPDHFVFIFVPIFLLVAGAGYVGFKLASVWKFYEQNVDTITPQRGTFTMLRYILLYDNYVGVRAPITAPDKVLDPHDCKFDTPIAITLPHRENMSLYEAQTMFRQMTEVEGVDIRFMYSTTSCNADCNIFHYLCYLNEEQKQQLMDQNSGLQFYPLRDLQQMIDHHVISPLMAAEIHRLYTIAMAWKTYTRDGRRRYPIKNYQPTFRIRDAHKWDVDYNDSQWFYVSINNQDQPFYAIRRFWRKYINGIGD